MSEMFNPNALVIACTWLFPTAYLIHLAEEYVGGTGFSLSLSLSRMRGVNLTPVQFLIMTGLSWVLMVAGFILSRKMGFPEWLLVCLGTALLVNGLLHTLTSVIEARYNPGAVTGLLIFIPLGAITLLLLKGGMKGSRYLGAMLVGIAIHGVVSLLSRNGGKLFAS